MRKIKILLIALILLVPLTVHSWEDTSSTGGGVSVASECNAADYYAIGKLCQDSDDGKLYKGTGSAVAEVGTTTTTLATDTLWDAAGDLVQGSGANTAAKLSKGAEGTLLRAGASLNAYSTFTMADTYTKGAIPYASTANTITALAHPGAANYLLTSNGTDTIAWSNSLSIATLDMTSATSSIPMTVSTSTGAQAAAGQLHFESDTYILSIGDGDATPISLDFAKDAAYVFPTTSATLARTDAGQTFTGVNVFTAPTFTTSITPTTHDGTTIGTSALGFSDIYLASGAVIYAQDDETNTMTSAAGGWTFAKPITISDVTNDNYIKITNNAGGRAPTASVYELYPDAGAWKVNTNGTENTMVDSANVINYAETLLSNTTVTFAADGDTTLYTVPSGKTCVLTKAIIVAAADCGSTDVTIGANGSETDFVGTQQLDNLDAAGDAVIITPVPNATPVKGKAYAATTVIQINVANHAGAADNKVLLFGI